MFGKEQPKKKKTDEKENKDKKNNYIREEDTAWMVSVKAFEFQSTVMANF